MTANLEQKTFVVLGMHRSATSLVAEGLHQEIFMGNQLVPASGSNPRGHFEDVRFVALNDRILAAAGGSWHQPPSVEALLSLSSRFSEQIRTLLSAAGAGKSHWGFKDPRTTLTASLYLPYLQNPHFICSFREPDAVAQSLRRRNGFSLTKGRQLAGIYNDRLIQFLTKFTTTTTPQMKV